jgi:ribosomal protein S21
MANVTIEKTATENNASVMRRFTKRVQSAGIVKKVRGDRYYSRDKSRTMRRKSTLKRLVKWEKIQELAKLGKLPEKTNKRR